MIMVSMQDIADKVGVSRSTVSLVLSGKAGSRVSEEVKKKVRESAKELNYHINDVARSLRTAVSIDPACADEIPSTKGVL